MNITISSLHELTAAQAQYEETLGWRVSVDFGHRRLVIRVGHEIDAITMPARLADRALAELRFAMLAGPVVAAPGGQWLTFLTTLAAAPRPSLPMELRRARVQLVPRDGQVIIPASLAADTGGWKWVEPPTPRRALPPWCVVVAAARRAFAW